MLLISANFGRSGLRCDLNALQNCIPCNREVNLSAGIVLTHHPVWTGFRWWNLPPSKKRSPFVCSPIFLLSAPTLSPRTPQERLRMETMSLWFTAVSPGLELSGMREALKHLWDEWMNALVMGSWGVWRSEPRPGFHMRNTLLGRQVVSSSRCKGAHMSVLTQTWGLGFSSSGFPSTTIPRESLQGSGFLMARDAASLQGWRPVNEARCCQKGQNKDVMTGWQGAGRCSVPTGHPWPIQPWLGPGWTCLSVQLHTHSAHQRMFPDF